MCSFSKFLHYAKPQRRHDTVSENFSVVFRKLTDLYKFAVSGLQMPNLCRCVCEATWKLLVRAVCVTLTH